MTKALVELCGITVSIGDRDIVRDVSLTVLPGDMHVIMGPNGSGKSTLAQSICGHPDLCMRAGTMRFEGKDLRDLPMHERAKAGILMAFQHPPALPGITVAQLIHAAAQQIHGKREDVRTFRARMAAAAASLGLPSEFLDRSVNDGFSGGEQKKCEVLQLVMLQPRLAILDEPDSGLDIDAMCAVGDAIGSLRTRENGVVVITHNPRFLRHLEPDAIHILINGAIVRSGASDVMTELEQRGFAGFDMKEKE